MIQIVEKMLVGKYGDDTTCEDGLYLGSDFIAVVDGATSKGNIQWDSHTSGWYAKKMILSELENLTYDATAQQAVLQLNACLANAYTVDLYAIVEESPQERLKSSIIIYSCHRNEIWSFGDCQCIIGNELHLESKKIDKLLSEIRSLYINFELENGKTKEELQKNDSGRAYISPLLDQQGKLANQKNEYGYAVLDGFALDLSRLKIYAVKDAEQVVLASDGYPVLENTLLTSEIKLQEILEEDPLCVSRYRSTKGLGIGQKSFDDRAYIRFKVIKA